MRTRTCLNCGELYESDAYLNTPFCGKECRMWHGMTDEEREEYLELACVHDYKLGE